MKKYNLQGTDAGIVKALNLAYQNGCIDAKTGIEILCKYFPQYKPGNPNCHEVNTVFYLNGRIVMHYHRPDRTLGIVDLFSKLYE